VMIHTGERFPVAHKRKCIIVELSMMTSLPNKNMHKSNIPKSKVKPSGGGGSWHDTDRTNSQDRRRRTLEPVKIG
jgi:hypothetical protein